MIIVVVDMRSFVGMRCRSVKDIVMEIVFVLKT